MLDLYIERANIQNGQEILDLGCGWGSFSLYAAAKFPESNITSVSNSFDQINFCLLYTSPSPRDSCASRMPSSA